MATSPAINTATWTCPICATTSVPVEHEAQPGQLTFTEMSWADVRTHLWQHEGGA